VRTKEGAILSSLAKVWTVSMRMRSPSSRHDSRIDSNVCSFFVVNEVLEALCGWCCVFV
jgi:hypothetical protein